MMHLLQSNLVVQVGELFQIAQMRCNTAGLQSCWEASSDASQDVLLRVVNTVFEGSLLLQKGW